MKIINLLPKDKQQEVKLRRIFNLLVSLIWVSGASFVLVLLLQFGTKAFLEGQQGRLQNSIADLKAQTGKEENAEIKNQVTVLNNLTSDYRTLAANIPKLSKVIRSFAPLVPDNISISSVRIDPIRKTMDINGYAPTRETVIRLYDNIVAASQDFPNVDYPLENVARPADINFHFSFNINEDLLK